MATVCYCCVRSQLTGPYRRPPPWTPTGSGKAAWAILVPVRRFGHEVVPSKSWHPPPPSRPGRMSPYSFARPGREDHPYCRRRRTPSVKFRRYRREVANPLSSSSAHIRPRHDASAQPHGASARPPRPLLAVVPQRQPALVPQLDARGRHLLLHPARAAAADSVLGH
ncbi:hypothetical protein CDD83_5944 [Cordyceps sp. RAO-2017]|nr:hypothetical protein CDD83_5944 [Cordyceps sp. RAO-2017]